jgi:6-phosphogluconolactonase
MISLSIHGTAEDAARETAGRVAAAVAAAVQIRGRAHVSLAGGSTPRRAYELLGALLDDAAAADWWFGDERCVPPDDTESNYRLVRESLLAAAPVPGERVHRIHGEDPPEIAAHAYEAELRRLVPAGAGGIPILDLALLGLGEDGHTASLFPGDPSLDVTDVLVLPVVASKPPPNRITLTLPPLKAAREVVILATGAGKRDAVRGVLAGPDPAVPASLLADARVTLVVDEAARP